MFIYDWVMYILLYMHVYIVCCKCCCIFNRRSASHGTSSPVRTPTKRSLSNKVFKTKTEVRTIHACKRNYNLLKCTKSTKTRVATLNSVCLRFYFSKTIHQVYIMFILCKTNRVEISCWNWMNFRRRMKNSFWIGLFK